MAKYSIGLTSIKMGAIAGDGGMGTSLTTIGNTVQDSASLTSEEGQITDFNIEEQDDPVESIVSQKGKITLAWSCYDVDPDTLVLFFGGTKIVGPPEGWAAPAVLPELERSIEIVPKNGGKIEIVRAKVSAKLNWGLSKTKLAQIDITAVVLAPTKPATAPITITSAS